MRKKIIFIKGTPPDNFSLKKLVKGAVNIVKDSVKLAVQPVKLAVSSVTGKPVKTEYSTKVGSVIGAVHDTGSKTLTSTVKGFADTVTGGLASKAANVLRKDEYKEKAFSYNEMKNPDKTGIKVLDKVATIAPTVGATVGGLYAGKVMAKKGADTVKKIGNMKADTILKGANVLKTTLPIPPDTSPLKMIPVQLPDGLPYGDLQDRPENENDQTLQAGFSLNKINPLFIAGIIALILAALFYKK